MNNSRLLPFYCTALVVFSPLFAENSHPALEFESSTPSAEVTQFPEATEAFSLETFSPFTGKVKGKKVRMRLGSDFESPIIMECDVDQMVSVIGEKGAFYAVEPPSTLKAYVFRNFIQNDVVQGSHVNIRLHPDFDAPVLGQLNTGDQVRSSDVANHPKWLAIQLPKGIQFYIAKEFVENIGDPEVYASRELRWMEGKLQCDAASNLSKIELNKPLSEMNAEQVVQLYQSILQKYADFPLLVQDAKDDLARFEAAYLLKQQDISMDIADKGPFSLSEKVQTWQPIEEGLYTLWARKNHGKSIDEFYAEQRLGSKKLSGILEPYVTPIKNRPGDFLLRVNDAIVACVYSTKVDLQKCLGKEVHLILAPRSNNHFAFDTYFVLDVE